MTVSNVCNRIPVVKPETQARVLEAIRETGYVPSQAARGLIGSIASRIGVVYFDTDLSLMDQLIAAISIAAADRGLQLIMRKPARFFLTEDWPQKDLSDLVDAFLGSGIQGLLLPPPIADALANSTLLSKLEIPIVTLGTATARPGMGTVRIDNRAAAYAVTELVVARGCRRVAVVAGPQSASEGRERFAGYCDALLAHELPVQPELCRFTDYSFASGLQAAEELLALSPRPDAIVAASDDLAAAALLAGHRLGLDLPRELAVVGFDDTQVATRVWPSLTSVRWPITTIAAQGLDLLVDAIRRREPALQDVVLDFQLVERDSVAPSSDRS